MADIPVGGLPSSGRRKSMGMIDIFNLYQDLSKDGVIFCFSGSTSQNIIEGIGETLRQRMELEGVGPSVINRVFAVFIEQIHNILHYSEEKLPKEPAPDGELRFGIVLVGMWGSRYYVRCGNYVSNSNVGPLSELLLQLRGMDKDQLKALFKERRKLAEQGDASKGAGLGLIEMARKSTEPLEFEITRVDDSKSFFSIITII
jgi:hypothetical protein